MTSLMLIINSMRDVKDTKLKGDINENYCEIEFLKLGFQCLYPRGDRARYDFVAEKEGRFLRIQCKCAHYSQFDKSTFAISCVSSNRKEGKSIKRYYNAEQIDFVATYINSKVYLISVTEIPKCGIVTLRLAPPKNNVFISCKFAENYEISKVVSNLGFTLPQEECLQNLFTENTFQVAKPIYKCPNCGTPVFKADHLCLKCSHEKRRILHLDRETLKSLLRTTSCSQIAENHGVSDQTVLKLCKQYNLPHNTYKIRKITEEEWANL